MNKNHSLNPETALTVFPRALLGTPDLEFFAGISAKAFSQLSEMADRVPIYLNIDVLPEELLDRLAYDLKIEWYDPEYSLEEKRKIIRNSWYVHRTIGTRAAVEKALSDIYPGARVYEWFEYEAPPGHFMVQIDITADTINSQKMRRTLQRLYYYKNLRSHNDGVHYFMRPPRPATVQAELALTAFHATQRARLDLRDLTRKPRKAAPAYAVSAQPVRRARIRLPLDLRAPAPQGTATGPGRAGQAFRFTRMNTAAGIRMEGTDRG